MKKLIILLFGIIFLGIVGVKQSYAISLDGHSVVVSPPSGDIHITCDDPTNNIVNIYDQNKNWLTYIVCTDVINGSVIGDNGTYYVAECTGQADDWTTCTNVDANVDTFTVTGGGGGTTTTTTTLPPSGGFTMNSDVSNGFTSLLSSFVAGAFAIIVVAIGIIGGYWITKKLVNVLLRWFKKFS
jgi:hypothetical protein